ncbi:RNA polymerase sigma factor, partial [candidate division KSB1 bacterium]
NGVLVLMAPLGRIFGKISTDEKDPEKELIRRAKNGDTLAFDELVVKYQKRVFFNVIRIVLNQNDADDVVQETFIKAYQNLESFDENYRFYTWIYRIAINTALNHVNHSKYKEESLEQKQEDVRFDPANEFDIEEDYDTIELKERIKKLLKFLSPEMRIVFTMRVYDQMTYKEISQILDISIGTVMSRLNRARINLKNSLYKIGL